MKPKQIFILAILLGILVAAVTIKSFHKPAELATEEFTPLDLSIHSDDVFKIDILKPKTGEAEKEEYVELERVNGNWAVKSLFNANADSQKIQSILDTLKNAKGEIRARDKELHGDFKIKEDEALRIKLSNSSQAVLLELLVGMRKTGQMLFVRKAGEDAVYLTEADIFGQVGLYGEPDKEGLSSDFWASLSVADLDPEKVEKFEIHRMEGGADIVSASLEKGPDPADATRKIWQNSRPAQNPFRADPEKVKQYLSNIKTWRAQKALDPNAKDYGFAKPSWKLVAQLPENKTFEITAGGIDDATKSYYIKVTDQPIVFQLIHYYFENLDADDSRFYPDSNVLSIENEKVTKLVVHSDKKEMKFNPKEKTWEALTNYLNMLKNDFRVKRLVFDAVEQKKARPSGRYWLEIQKEGEPSKFIDMGDMISLESKEYAAQIRGAGLPFAIDEALFKKLFENPDALAKPKT